LAMDVLPGAWIIVLGASAVLILRFKSFFQVSPPNLGSCRNKHRKVRANPIKYEFPNATSAKL
jgi:hypothetical protein